MGIRPQKNCSPDSEIAQDVLEQTEMIFQGVRRNAMQAYIKYKLIMIEKPTLQNWNNLIMFTFYSRKQITREVKLPLQIFGGLDHMSLKMYGQTILIWYAKLAPIKRNFCTE